MKNNELAASPDSEDSPRIIKALCEGNLQLAEGGVPLTVAVLEDGTRLIGRNDMFRAFGRTHRGRAKGETRAENLPSFADAKNLQPYITQELYEILTTPIKCRTSSGRLIDGYRAIALPLLCDAYLDAKNAKKLTVQQAPLAVAALAIVRSLSKIGIIALIDEVTGYQFERERDALQQLVRQYVAEELRPWTKTFPDVFYREIFRLNGWDFTVNEIRKRPPIIGKWTNMLIYEPMPKGVLAQLKSRTPKSAAGNYTARFFQSLSEDMGVTGLQLQLNSCVSLMQISETWPEFISRFNLLQQRRAGQLGLDLNKALPPPLPAKPTNVFDASLKGLLDTPPPPKPEKRKKKPKPLEDEAEGEQAGDLAPA